MSFDFLKGKFGFGCMRLPMLDEKNVDDVQFSKMIEDYMHSGFNYFDTAHGYIDGESEKAIKRCLTSKYDRDKYMLTNKLTSPYFNTKEDVRTFFNEQLDICGVDYFDFYLMHSQNKDNFKHFKKCEAYETAFELKKDGKIRHVGLSFHDTADVLDMILSEYSDIEVVQIQYNYIDYDDNAVQSKLAMDVCKKYNKPVIIMEPVKGGSLANIPEEAKKIYEKLGDATPASYAMRFAASDDSVIMVLSGMSSEEQMRDNIKTMKDFRKLDEEELKSMWAVRDILKSKNVIPCTDCKYCVEGCPKNIRIPNLFSCYNAKTIYKDWNQDFYYSTVHTVGYGKASDCISCKKCEKVCPQHIKISRLMLDIAKEFEKASN